MRILIIENRSLCAAKFRLPLIRFLVSKGNEVFVAAGDIQYEPQIEAAGAIFVKSDGPSNRSTRIITDLLYYSSLKKIIKNGHFDSVLTFQLKPNIYGCLAAKKEKVIKIFPTVEGIGDPFIKRGLKWTLIKQIVSHLMKKAFKNIDKVFFLNNDSSTLFIDSHILRSPQSRILPGMGVDVSKFAYSPIVNYGSVLMVGRLLKTKGVLDYCEAAKLYKTVHHSQDVTFYLLGEEADLKKSDLQKYIVSGVITYLGFSDDIINFYKNSTLLVLPSYYEGAPMAIMEAMSIGRPIIATKVPGCKEMVEDGKNGFLVPKQSPQELCAAIEKILSDRKMINEFGNQSRKMAETLFDSKLINEEIYDLIAKG